MKKIPCLFVRDEKTGLVLPEVRPGCEWVASGEGQATAKWDGTACMVLGGRLYKRYDGKRGKKPPENFIPAQHPDEGGHWPGWVPVGEGPEDKYHRAAFHAQPDGTYELVGPKVQSNPHNYPEHTLLRHGAEPMGKEGNARDYEALQSYLARIWYEGIVWHHPDGRMAKLRRKDFGLSWPRKDKEMGALKEE